MDNANIKAAIDSLGGPSSVARLRDGDGLRGRTPWAISKWIIDGVPADNVLWLCEKTGWKWSPHQIAPELYPHPDDGLPADLRSTAAAA